MEVILDELKQYDLKRIINIKNIGFDECERTLNNKYYLFVQFQNNIIISISVYKRIKKWKLLGYLQNKKKHSYEIEHNFKMQYICDMFYNFCLNNFTNFTNFINPTIQIKQLYLYQQSAYEINNVTCCKISLSSDIKKNFDYFEKMTKIKTILNLNELHLFRDAINEHEISTFVQVSFEQN